MNLETWASILVEKGRQIIFLSLSLNYVTNILLDRIFTRKLVPVDQEIVFIASKRETNAFLNENFRNYLKGQALNTHKVRLHIEIKTPSEEKALQAVDFISWAVFRKHEYQDGSYYDMVKKKIVEENPLFP